MHLHTLRFGAVGPFPGEHTVDIAELASSGLFLLEGPTGAGKSTIIDMIVFSLYGKVASREATEERLRSAYADPGTETYVDLVLETGAGIYRVRRTPQYQRPKQRGTGTTTQQATVKLWRLTSPDSADHGELVSTRLDEVGAELQRVIGLDRDQFVQTIVLPQGEFAGFLRAKPEDRRGLLQKVFGTAVYEQVQVRLERMRAEVTREVGEAEARIRQAVEGFVGAARLDDEPTEDLRELAEATTLDGDRLLETVEGHGDRLTLLAEEAEARAAEAKERCSARLTVLDEARALQARVDRRAALRAEQTVLDDQAEGVARATERCETARRAEAVRDAVDAADRATRGVADARDRVTAAVTAAPADLRESLGEHTEGTADGADGADGADTGGAEGAQDAEDTLPDRLSAEKDRCTGLLAVLEQLTAVERGLPRRRDELAGIEATIADLEPRLAEQHSERAARPVVRAEIETRLAEAHDTAAGLGVAQAAVEAAERRLVVADEVATLTAELETAQAELARLTTAARTAVTHEATVRAARLAGIAAELAADLTDGDLCAVCGSPDHPVPARLGADHVDADTVTAAETARAGAERLVNEAAERRSRIDQTLTQRRTDLGGLTTDQAKEQLLTAERSVTTARTAERTVTELHAQLRAFDEATVALDQRISATETDLARRRALLTERRTALGADESRVTAALDGCTTVAERARLLRARTEAVITWFDACTAHRAARTAHTERLGERDTALARAAFPDAATARAALLDPTELTRLEEQVQAHRQAQARVTHGLHAPEIAALPDVVDVDVDAAIEAHREADAAATAASQAAATAQDRSRAAARTTTQVRTAITASATARAAAAPVIRMANLAAASSADNATQVTLATYVLGRRFEDVVAAANGRLRTMSSGRFELVRSEEKEAVRARRKGLAMKVVDHHTGAGRDPRTLSGGETFYVSLCLALGLADVVTAEAGGTDLGTLFVDEGFGTLDAETLDVVLAELGRLRDGGRVVGVVSHVEALKQAVAERIEIRPLHHGGSTLTVRA